MIKQCQLTEKEPTDYSKILNFFSNQFKIMKLAYNNSGS